MSAKCQKRTHAVQQKRIVILSPRRRGRAERRRDKRGRVGDKIPQRVHRNESDACTLAFYITKRKSHDQRERRPGSSGVQAFAIARRSRCWGRSGSFVSDHVPSGGGEDGTASGWISRHAKGASAM